MTCLFLYNPAGGRGKVKAHLGYIVRRLSETYEVECAETANADDLETRIKQFRGDVVVVAGGDGTFHRALQAAAEREIALGYLPCGTMNDIARSVGIPRNLRRALDAVLCGRIRRFDCIRIGKRYCMYLAAAGAPTRLSYQTPASLKRKWGRLAYFFYGLKHSLRFPPFPVELACGSDRLKTAATLLFVMNGRCVAGCPANREGSMTDGIAEVALLEPASKAGELFSLAGLLLGGKQRLRRVDTLRGRRISVRVPQSVVWDLDGEEGPRGSVELEVLPQKIPLFVPSSKKI